MFPRKLELSNVRQVAAGDYHTLFVTESGLLYGAGCSYDYDQLATGKFENENRPVRIMGGIERAWAGRDISAALDEEGAIWVWGANDVGQLGLGHTEAVDGPTQDASGGRRRSGRRQAVHGGAAVGRHRVDLGRQYLRSAWRRRGNMQRLASKSGA